MKPEISIIVPVFNREKYLERCLDSLVNQTFKDIEIIIINDCSTDRSLDIINNYLKYDNVFLINFKENKGVSAARNAGLKIAKGNLIGFVDSDDYVALDMYEKLFKKFQETDADIVDCDYYQQSEKRLVKMFSIPHIVFNNNGEELKKSILLNSGRMWTKIFKKELFDKYNIKFPEGYIYEDNEVIVSLILCAEKIAKVKEHLYYCWQSEISITRSKDNYSFFDRLVTSKNIIRNAKDLKLYHAYKDEIDFKFIELFYLNTIVGCVKNFKRPQIYYLKKVKREVYQLLPDFENNKYFKTMGIKKKIMHKSLKCNPFLFIMLIYIFNVGKKIFRL